jgi:hypothetical protein
MYRLRFATLLVATGVGLMCGCMSLSQHPLFGRRLHGECPADCCDIGALPDSAVPLGGGMGPALPPPGPGLPPAGPATQNGLAEPGRLQPIPTAPTAPYNPTTQLRSNRRTDPKAGD